MRAVLDPNILIAALLSPGAAPAQIVARWLAGEFELVTSDAVVAELARAMAYPKLRSHISKRDAEGFVALLQATAMIAVDPPGAVHHSADPDDDYLLALAEAERAMLVSGDEDLLALADRLPIETARAFLDRLGD